MTPVVAARWLSPYRVWANLRSEYRALRPWLQQAGYRVVNMDVRAVTARPPPSGATSRPRPWGAMRWH